MTIEARTAAMGNPFGVAAIFTGIEPENTHVLGPMGLWPHDISDAIAAFLLGQCALHRMVLPILGKDFVNVDAGRHGKSPKKKPDQEDRASCGNGG